MDETLCTRDLPSILQGLLVGGITNKKKPRVCILEQTCFNVSMLVVRSKGVDVRTSTRRIPISRGDLCDSKV